MKPPSVNQLSVLLAGTLLLCHGVFGALHLVCDSPACAAEHAAGHEPAAGAANAHEHPADHGTGTEYFAVVAGLLGLLLGALAVVSRVPNPAATKERPRKPAAGWPGCEIPEIRELAQNIMSTQQEEIEQMKRWREQWYPEG